jgi:hypothetical protein
MIEATDRREIAHTQINVIENSRHILRPDVKDESHQDKLLSPNLV